MLVKKLGLLLLSSSFLVACGGSDSDDTTLPDVPPPVTETPDTTEYNHQVQGIVAYQGAVAGADVCVDLDMNQLCGAEEPTSSTDNDGFYQIDWVSTTETPHFYLLANWTDTSNSNPAQPQLLSSAFKAEKLKHTVSTSSTSSTAASSSKVTAVISNGDAQLIAMSEHGGAINALTHLEFQRYEQMLTQELSADEIQALRLQLSIILDALYAPLTGEAYQVTADRSASAEFLDTYFSHQHIAALIGDRLMATLAIDEVMAASKASIAYLALHRDVTISDYLANDPIDVRFLVNDTLIAQGYIVTPFDDKIMADGDWQVLQTSLLSDDTHPHKFSLAPAHYLNFYSLEFGDSERTLSGFISNNQLTGSVIDTGNAQEVATACWNEQLEKWINPERDDQGYTPVVAQYTNNTVNTHYLGTSVAINIQIEKHLTNTETWGAILNAQPEQLKLSELQWPEYIYRYHIEQADDVICRAESNANAWDMPTHNSAEMLTTADIARLFWDDFYPQDVVIDEITSNYQ
ncbi:hypothetical protein [Shewanella sp. UCD-KL12]|uniref:hypothetical protein n=1 Tax=Shewanella sp. UCD-KL12 TaxID=1917163 RepID=UPI0009703CC9|nr:hypothetical protein [Shewanella sp. UCD-KL12]